ncbi:MAG TPA: hypothetical protein VM452_01785 [Caulifigura sp.]|nr:hypothetical protein [Caulifigura sp.]
MKTLACVSVLLVSVAATASAAPFLEGTVLDEEGRPIPGAAVKVWSCLGTCLGGKTILTNADGGYRFETRPFANASLVTVDLPGRYEVSRRVTGPALEQPETDVPRRTDFVLGVPAAATVFLKGDPPRGWTQTFQLRAGRDARVHRYDIHGSGGDRTYASFNVLPRNESLHLVVIRQPILPSTGDVQEDEKQNRKNWRSRVESISAPFRLVDVQRYSIHARVEQGAGQDKAAVVIEKIQDAVDADRTHDLLVADPLYGPAVEGAAREQALELLKRVQKAAAPWNARPSKAVESYEYDAVAADGEKTHIRIDKDSPTGPAWNDISRLRGFAYMPPLRWLFSQPDKVVFHGVEIGDERAVLTYQLKERRGFAAGLGVGPRWNGFFQRSFSAGKVVIEVKNATVLEHRLMSGPLEEEAVETFSDYVAVGEGFAPRVMRIQTEGQDYRLSFQVHKDKLWLLETGTRGDDEKPALRIENVVVAVTGE